jgi:predicted membrane protein
LVPRLDRKGLREFGLVTGGVVALLFGLFFPWLLEFKFPLWPWVVFAVLGALGLVAPTSLRPVHYWWMRFALLLSKITTPIILGVVFYLLVTPIGLIMRMLGKDPMKRARGRDLDTYRVLPIKSGKSNLEKPY